MKLFFPILFSLVLFNACTKKDSPVTANEARNEMNVSYGSDPQQKMDIYLPANRSTTNTKVLIYIHGGGWSGGDKADINAGIPAIQQILPGYAIVSINYRLYKDGNNKFPVQENDIQSAINFLLSKQAEYVYTDKLVLIGVSAGAHLALLHGYKHDDQKKIKTIISIVGPTDVTLLYNTNKIVADMLLVPILGGTPATQPELYNQSSPINFVTGNAPPTIIFQGGKDPLIPVSQGNTLASKLTAQHVINQSVLYPDGGHGWGEPALTDTYQKIKAFLAENVK